jgi:hypothetical protein
MVPSKYILAGLLALLLIGNANATGILIPMDDTQKNHLKSYGITYYLLKNQIDVDWLLNYRGGSFLTEYSPKIIQECKVRDITFEVISDQNINKILEDIASPHANMNVVKLERAPRIAVYSPKYE